MRNGKFAEAIDVESPRSPPPQPTPKVTDQPAADESPKSPTNNEVKTSSDPYEFRIINI